MKFILQIPDERMPEMRKWLEDQDVDTTDMLDEEVVKQAAFLMVGYYGVPDLDLRDVITIEEDTSDILDYRDAP